MPGDNPRLLEALSLEKTSFDISCFCLNGKRPYAVIAPCVLDSLLSPCYKILGFLLGRLLCAGDVFPGFSLSGRETRELNIFVDESRSDGLSNRYHLLTVVMHDQSNDTADPIAAYEGALRAKRLPDTLFHASPLVNGKNLNMDQGMEVCSIFRLLTIDQQRWPAE